MIRKPRTGALFREMIVNTKLVFLRLLRTMRIDVVCDVGSMDGADALRFRDALPNASIYAFEPNPANLTVMKHDVSLRKRGIVVLPYAVANRDGDADFFVVTADPAVPDSRGWSSLHRRSAVASAAVRVRTVRLDSILAHEVTSGARLALWIDVEGKAFEVIEGVRRIAACVDLLHVEVETSACIGSEQRLYPQVKHLLQELGFKQLATDWPVAGTQFNALFARADLPSAISMRMRFQLARAWVRRRCGTLLARLSPACFRWYRKRAVNWAR
jgi:FkbM family methyltransferase